MTFSPGVDLGADDDELLMKWVLVTRRREEGDVITKRDDEHPSASL